MKATITVTSIDTVSGKEHEYTINGKQDNAFEAAVESEWDGETTRIVRDNSVLINFDDREFGVKGTILIEAVA